MKSVNKITFTLKASYTVYLTFSPQFTMRILMLILYTGSSPPASILFVHLPGPVSCTNECVIPNLVSILSCDVAET